MVRRKPHIPRSVLRNWNIDKNNIFKSKYKYTDECIFKFCYQLDTGELLFDIPPTHHKFIVLNHGRKKFGAYVRGICFWDKKVIYLRMHEREEWMRDTKSMLRRQGVPKRIRIVWGRKARRALAEDLKGL